MCKKWETLNIEQRTIANRRADKRGPGVHQRNVVAARAGNGSHPRVPTREDEMRRSVAQASGSGVASSGVGSSIARRFRKAIADQERLLSTSGGMSA